MNLPELPSEQQIAKWLQGFRPQVLRYGRTLWLALRSPISVVRHSMRIRSARLTKAPIGPLPFVLLTLVCASLLHAGAMTVVGVDEPFFRDLPYHAQTLALQHAITALGRSLPGEISGFIVLATLRFAAVLLVVVFWARVLAGRARRYWTDLAALSYLLPLALLAEIIEYGAINLLYRTIGQSALLFASATLLILILAAFVVYGVVLRVVDQVYFTHGWRRIVYAAGYLTVVPVLLFVLQAAVYALPVGVSVYRVIGPTVEGDRKLLAGDYEAAETLFRRAIDRDVTGFWCGGARIRLISVEARRILALLPNLSLDSGLRERLLRRLAQADPFQRVLEAWRPEGAINVASERLVEFRDAILDSYLSDGDIPVTNSELDCALRPTAKEEGCDLLPKEAISRGARTPVQRQQLSDLIYRARALDGEPTTADARRYLQFLAELPIRIELLFVRYHARNLMRESETLAGLDDQDRHGVLDRDALVKANRQIRDQGAKYPHLKMSDAQLEKLSDREFGFLFRQVYLGYLRTEARLLAASRVSGESSLIGQRVASIEEQLTWAASDVMYRGVPPTNDLDEALLKLFGFK